MMRLKKLSVFLLVFAMIICNISTMAFAREYSDNEYDSQYSYHYIELKVPVSASYNYNGNTYIADGVTTTKEAIIAGGAMDEVVVLDGTNKLISGTKGATARIVGDHFNWEWIPFVYGENNITVSGNCTIKFEWLEPRKVGSL